MATPTLRRAISAGGLAAFALVLVACSGPVPASDTDGAPSEHAAEAGHIHGLALDESSGTLHIATHEGVFVAVVPAEMQEAAQPVPLGDYRGDVMGFVRIGDRLLISGHPGHDDGGAPNVGVLESDLSGEEWTALALQGAVDFHAMAAGGASVGEARVVGIDSATGRVLVSPDGGSSWQEGPQLQARSLAWNDDATGIFATTAEGLQVGSGNGSDFAVVAGAPALVLLSSSPVGSKAWRLAGIDVEGVLHLSSDGRSWTAHGTVPFLPEAMGVGTAGAVVIADATRIARTIDDGVSWETIVTF